ncbi:MAG: YhcH/YjgK/YiaL family protein [Bacteroidaceae bacterium]|nr:YhcH/YjgK/YiaL family protein [Bacteroidaceae bacterium]MBR5275833.1 YhcH/YjgK/YiaL family protein [Bacteroidaceae bacterium]
MILDTLDNLDKYASLNPLFPKAIEFLKNSDLNSLPLGRNEIMGDEIFANVMEVQPRTKEEVPVEIHRKYIDIQVPISGDEVMGYTPKSALPVGEYSDANDVTLYPIGMLAQDYVNVKQSMFTIFFPQDGHAPAVTPVKVKKVIVKIAVK